MSVSRDLRRLARLYGLQTEFYDVGRRLQSASERALLRTLPMLGCPIEHAGQAAELVPQRRRELWSRVAPPVVVAWDGAGEITVRLPENDAGGELALRIVDEDDRERTVEHRLADLPVARRRTFDDTTFVARRIPLPEPLPAGYHRATLETPVGNRETLIVSAPRVAYCDDSLRERRSWGAFLPLHALHRSTSWGAGNFSDLEALVDWVSSLGGNLVASLPMLAAEVEFGGDPSPYSPSSRLVWNEFFLDVTRVTGFDQNPEVQDLVGSEAFQNELAALRAKAVVDYERQSKLQRSVLEKLSAAFFERDAEDRRELDAFVDSHPVVVDYARYKAVRKRQGTVWPEWPEPLRGGTVSEDDYDRQEFEFYLFVQWQVYRQLHELAEEARRDELLWYLDFTLGVSRAGFDVWRNRDVFALDASGGAPPDAFFTRGQNWGFPPLHPQRLREQHYAYFIECLHRHLAYGRLLRFDHVMGLHRLFWIPEGFDARDGVYVRYHAEDLFAILCLETHRYEATIVGENLGTVPEAVNRAMERHGILDMYVVQYEADENAEAERPLRPVPSTSVASVNTHDMPTFTSFWTALDVDDRIDLGLMTEEEGAAERERRARLRHAIAEVVDDDGRRNEELRDPRDALDAAQLWLADSPAACVFVNLEDLWLETLPQNTPGTFLERCNWRQRTRFSFEEFSTLEPFVSLLREMGRRRRE